MDIKNTLPSLSRRNALAGMASLGAGLFLGPSWLRANNAVAESPGLPGRQPGYYRFKIGGLDALALNDGGFAVPTANSPMGGSEPLSEKVEVLEDHFLGIDQLSLQFNVLLLNLAGKWVLVDTGAGAAFGDAGGNLVPRLKTAGIEPEQIDAIVITHMHGDHFGGLLDADGQVVFKNAELFIHGKEHDFWSGSDSDFLGEGAVAGARKYLKAFEGKWQLVEGGDLIHGKLEVIDAFGHTPGHMMLGIDGDSERIIHMVDLVHHHALSLAHPEWPMKFDVYKEQGIATRQKVLGQFAEDRTRVFGAHMPFPSLGHIRRKGQGYEYVIEPWQEA